MECNSVRGENIQTPHQTEGSGAKTAWLSLLHRTDRGNGPGDHRGSACAGGMNPPGQFISSGVLSSAGNKPRDRVGQDRDDCIVPQDRQMCCGPAASLLPCQILRAAI
ncbi:MAG TPA: hypothetical protein DCG12_21780 [Planctomycetaceae bacterium]|nr:hypothetical protein [Planctomycetaceae bacterium]